MNCVIIGSAIYVESFVETGENLMMKVFDRITDIVRDDMAEAMKENCRCSSAAS